MMTTPITVRTISQAVANVHISNPLKRKASSEIERTLKKKESLSEIEKYVMEHLFEDIPLPQIKEHIEKKPLISEAQIAFMHKLFDAKTAEGKEKFLTTSTLDIMQYSNAEDIDFFDLLLKSKTAQGTDRYSEDEIVEIFKHIKTKTKPDSINYNEDAAATIQRAYSTYHTRKAFKSIREAKAATMTKPTTIKETRKGYDGIVRPTSELTPFRVYNLINHKVNNISPAKVGAIINSFPQEDRKTAAKVFQVLSQFGNMKSLNVLETSPLSSKEFLGDDHISLNSVLCYLKRKGNFTKSNFLEDEGQLVLDHITMERLKTDPEFCEKIKSNKNITLIYPEGYINGVNPFNQHEDIRCKISTIMKTLKKSEEISPESISKAVNASVVKDIETLGLKDKLVILPNKEKLDKQATNQNIASQMESPSVNLGDFTKILANKKNESHYLEMLAHCIEILSPRKMSVKLQKLHTNILSKSKGINPKEICYYVPDIDKSYGIIAMHYKIANNIPLNQFFTDIDKIPKNCKKVVILDDIAGSGESLAEVHNYITGSGEGHSGNSQKKFFSSDKICVAPLLCTDEALKIFKGDNIVYAKKIKVPENTDFYKKLKPFQQSEFRIVGEMDENDPGNNCNVGFSYMAPDNNNTFFGKLLAHFFTLNGNGVKAYGWVD